MIGRARAALLGTVALAALLPMAAQAQDQNSDDAGGLAEIVVTATKRSENLQNVPIAVTAIGADTLDRVAIDSGTELAKLTPNLALNTGSAFFAPYLRGVGTQYANLGLESSVAVYFDDLYMSRPQGGFASFNDIERVEVLKGPQGTLFGRNAAGGAIRIITKDPTREFEGNAAVTYGRFDRIGVEGMINIPLGPTLSARFAYYHDERDGYVRNIDPDKPRLNNRNIDMIRGKLLFEPSDSWSMKLSVDYTRKEDLDGLAFINLEGAPTQTGVAIGGTPSPGFYVTTQDSPPKGDTTLIEQFGISLRSDFELDGATLSSITGYRYAKLFALASDLDTVDIPLLHDDYLEASDSYSQELQIVSNAGGPLDWLMGAYYFREEGGNTFTLYGLAMDQQFGVPSGPNVGTREGGANFFARSRLVTESFAPYAQASYDLTDRFEILVGVRYTWEKKKLLRNQLYLGNVGPDDVPLGPPELNKKRTFREFTPKVTLSYKPVDDVLLYATYSKGFKSGGINTPTFAPADTVEPELLTSYELGWKTEFGRVRFNGAAFYYDFKDLQVQRTDQTTGGTRVENAAAAEIFGIEADLTWAVTDRLELGMGGGLLKTKYKDYEGDAYVPAFGTPACAAAQATPDPADDAACLGYAVQRADFSGDSLPQAPKASGFVRAQYTQPLPAGELRFNSLLSYSGKYFYNPEHTLDEPEKFLLSGSIAWASEGDRYSVTLFGDNLLGEKYHVLKVRQNTGGWRIPAPPRTWGVKLAARF